jgi:uncharacterized protein
MSNVRDNPAASRVEMTSGGSTAFVEYRRAGNTIVLTHTEIPEALSGERVGSKRVRARSLPCGPTG